MITQALFHANSHHGRHHAPVPVSTKSEMPKAAKLHTAIIFARRCRRLASETRKPNATTTHRTPSHMLIVRSIRILYGRYRTRQVIRMRLECTDVSESPMTASWGSPIERGRQSDTLWP